MRIFIAALLPEEIIDHIVSYKNSIRDRVLGVKWERSEKLHITLKFLGNIDDEQLIEVNKAVERVVTDISKIELTVSHFGAFPSLSRPRILYTGFNTSAEIMDLQKNIDSSLLDLGFEKEKRKFTAHVTIGRVKSRFELSSPLPIIEKKSFKVDKIGVIESLINSRGSSYKKVNLYELD